jgi:hypothetical protein
MEKKTDKAYRPKMLIIKPDQTVSVIAVDRVGGRPAAQLPDPFW